MLGFKVWKEKPGQLAPTSVWCCSYSCYLHINNSLIGLLWNVVTEYKNDRHLVG